MSRHNYTNPAFCQQDEFYRPPSAQPTTPTQLNIVKNSPARVHRSESSRSFHSTASHNRSLRTNMQRNGLNCSHHQLHLQSQSQLSVLATPPRPIPAPKPNPNTSQRIIEGFSAVLPTRVIPPPLPPIPPQNLNKHSGSRYGSISEIQPQSSSGRYALVPVEDLPVNNKGRYAVLPAQTASRFVKSQENLDKMSSEDDGDELPHNYSADNAFSSLPPVSTPQKEGRLVPAFSTDFGSKSFILFDQKSQQRYAVVPTEDNEECVDDNHEIIQMHNGKAHRYAVIPTEEEETCLNAEFERNPPYATVKSRQTSPQRTPQKQLLQQRITEQQIQQQNMTPQKANLATQKLHELLSTPQKQFVRQNSTPMAVRSSPYRVNPLHASNPRLASTPKQKNDFTPQRLTYDQKARMVSSTTLNLEQRTTAVIQPRLHTAASIYNETTTTATDKSWNNDVYKSHNNATCTIAIVSLMLMLTGAINSGLCLYITGVNGALNLYTGRSYFLDVGIVSGFAAITLGFLGFRSRHCDWFPNRNYISGYILVTVFALLNCCGLLVLLVMKPIKGTPLHDVTTGIILGLSSLCLMLISLGVITSRLCRAPPIDNRVDVC